jgi:hypothetical protein
MQRQGRDRASRLADESGVDWLGEPLVGLPHGFAELVLENGQTL